MTNDRELVFWPFVIVVILALGVATLTVVSSSRPKIIINAGEVPTPTPPETERLNITIFKKAGVCLADPADPVVQPGSEVCFVNKTGGDVYVRFLEEDVIEGNVVEILVKDGDTACINIKEHISGSLPLELEFVIKDDQGEECSDPSNRPKIIIDR